MGHCSARVAVSSTALQIDRPYEYRIPPELEESVEPGKRVFVPFGRGNRVTEGMVLSVGDAVSREDAKDIIRVLDSVPVLTPRQIQLALFMRERFFCTVYDAVKAILPVGIWLDDKGRQRIQDRKTEVIRLTLSREEAEDIASARASKAPQQARLLRELAVYQEMPARDLLSLTGAGRPSLKHLIDSGCADVYFREYFRRPEYRAGRAGDLPQLNSEQSGVYAGLRETALSGESRVALLQGVTGSGKTSIYIRLISDVLEAGKSAILLVPEIALTPQMLTTFSAHFGDLIAVLHSNLAAGERYDEWKRIRQGKARLVIGTRSAVFAPCEDTGLIIIDEEQEDTYKSESIPRYSAVDIAKYRCFKSSCMLLLGSATPRIESRYYAQCGKYLHFRLNTRYNEKELPKVHVVDMKTELKSGNSGCISSYLRDEIAANIEKGEQTLLFLNRRGANRFVTCTECGYIFKCPNCSVSLTYHSAGKRLLCHYCGYSMKAGSVCPDCGGMLSYVGMGTQLIESEIKELFPDVPAIRIDADILNADMTHEKVFEKFSSENIPIMIGTQMITKGLNFDNVTLVGVISADQSLYCGDFRASEKTFSLITQVIGRSGRGEKPGRAVIQTFTPDNEVISCAAEQDYERFYSSEIISRELQNSPPYSDLFSISITGLSESSVREAAGYVKKRLAFILKDIRNTDILGPVPYSVMKVSNRFRYRVNIKCNAGKEIRSAIASVVIECSRDKRFKDVSFFADNDIGEY